MPVFIEIQIICVFDGEIHLNSFIVQKLSLKFELISNILMWVIDLDFGGFDIHLRQKQTLIFRGVNSQNIH